MDPIKLFSTKMMEQGILKEAEIKEIEEVVAKEINEAVEYAINSPFPEPEELYTDLYV